MTCYGIAVPRNPRWEHTVLMQMHQGNGNRKRSVVRKGFKAKNYGDSPGTRWRRELHKCNSQDDTDDYCPGTLHRGTLTKVTRCCPTEASKRSPPLPLREGGKAADDSAGKGTAPFWYSQGCSKPRPRSEFCRALQEDKA